MAIIIYLQIKEGMSYLKLTPSSGITYAAAEYVRNKILKYDIEYGNGYKVIVIDFSRVSSIDYTAGKVRLLLFLIIFLITNLDDGFHSY